MNMFHEISKLEPILKFPIYLGFIAFFIGVAISLQFSRPIGMTITFSGFYMMWLVTIGSLIFHKELSTHVPKIFKIIYAMFAIHSLILTEELHDEYSFVIPSFVYVTIAVSFILVFYGCFINKNE